MVLSYMLLVLGVWLFISKLVERSRAEAPTRRRDALGAALMGLMAMTIAVGQILRLDEGLAYHVVLGTAVVLALAAVTVWHGGSSRSRSGA